MILVDTGPLVAAALAGDTNHVRCVELFTSLHLNAEQPLGIVDASVVAIAEELGVSEVATLDRRHFTVVRPKHVDALSLLP